MSASAARRRARGAQVELLVVVIGVLIALAADSAFQARMETADEQRYLSALNVDLSDARQAIERPPRGGHGVAGGRSTRGSG